MITPELQVKISNLSAFQRKYCEYRSKGLTQSLAALKAGSTAQDEAARGRVGYQIEQIDGVKDYIYFLSNERAKITGIDELEVISKLREVYDASMKNEKFQYALGSVELLGMMIGLFSKQGKGRNVDTVPVNPVEAFKEEEDQIQSEDRIKQLQTMLKALNKA